MPGFDRTGPEGQGSQTGRRLGKCNPNNQKQDEQVASEDNPKVHESRIGRGLARGFGFARGRGIGRGQGGRLGKGNA